jgi:hypothetical protein
MNRTVAVAWDHSLAVTETSYNRAHSFYLTLIVPGEVKVDLDNFDSKLREKLIMHFTLKNTYSAKTSFKSFLI